MISKKQTTSDTRISLSANSSISSRSSGLSDFDENYKALPPIPFRLFANRIVVINNADSEIYNIPINEVNKLGLQKSAIVVSKSNKKTVVGKTITKNSEKICINKNIATNLEVSEKEKYQNVITSNDNIFKNNCMVPMLPPIPVLPMTNNLNVVKTECSDENPELNFNDNSVIQHSYEKKRNNLDREEYEKQLREYKQQLVQNSFIPETEANNTPIPPTEAYLAENNSTSSALKIIERYLKYIFCCKRK